MIQTEFCFQFCQRSDVPLSNLRGVKQFAFIIGHIENIFFFEKLMNCWSLSCQLFLDENIIVIHWIFKLLFKTIHITSHCSAREFGEEKLGLVFSAASAIQTVANQNIVIRHVNSHCAQYQLLFPCSLHHSYSKRSKKKQSHLLDCLFASNLYLVNISGPWSGWVEVLLFTEIDRIGVVSGPPDCCCKVLFIVSSTGVRYQQRYFLLCSFRAQGLA